MKKKCLNCGKEFESEVGQSKYCSVACRVASWRKKLPRPEKKLHEKVCEYCGKKFLAKNVRQKYCSEKCNYAMKYQKSKDRRKLHEAQPLKKYKKICKHCGKEFETYESTKEFCTNACKVKNRQAQKKRLAYEPRECNFCGAKFYPDRPNQRYCSAACSRITQEYERDKSTYAKLQIFFQELQERGIKPSLIQARKFVGTNFDKSKSVSTLDESIREAERLGISYGELCKRRQLEAMKK